MPALFYISVSIRPARHKKLSSQNRTMNLLKTTRITSKQMKIAVARSTASISHTSEGLPGSDLLGSGGGPRWRLHPPT